MTGLLAHSPSALTIFDLDGRCVLVNSAYREIFGSEPAPDYDLLSDEQLEPGFRERVKRAYAGEEARLPAAWYAPDELRRLSVRSERRAGIAVSIFPLREADSRVAYIAIGFEDARAGLQLADATATSLRQQAELIATAALRDSEARKAAILEAALDCIVTADATGRITEFNAAAERTFHYSRAQVLGKPLVDLLVPPSLREKHLAAFERFVATGAGNIIGRRVEVTAMRADGSEFPVELALAATRVSGAPSFTAYIRDLTERRLAREALAQAEARFLHLSESGIIGIIITDTDGTIHEANDEFLRIIGFSRADLISNAIDWTTITPPEWRLLDEAAIEELIATGVAKPWEKEYFRKDGSRVPVLVGVVMHEPGHSIAFVIDQSKRQRAEAARAHALEAAKQELVQRERAEAALRHTEEQLRQSQKLEAIGRLAGSIAHDFNNLLSVIHGYSVITLDELSAVDPLRADIEQIALAAQRATDLTRQLLAFSRQQVLQPKVVDLNEIIAGMVKMLRRIIGEHVRLDVLPAARATTVFVDPGQIEQVLLNLIVNARDAMPEGGVITIETARATLEPADAEQFALQAGVYVVLRVRDTGTGMDHDTLERVFEPFFTTKPKGKGTGLGLSTAFGIVKQSGGAITVRSAPGQGATFEIYLPRSRARATPSEQPPTTPPEHRGEETILLVEDDPAVRTLASTLLRRHGYHVLEAENGGDALLICEQHHEPIHLLLTDVVMPRMTGQQLWQRLTRLRPQMRVLFMSGYSPDSGVPAREQPASDAFLYKPFVPADLLAIVRRRLDTGA